MGKSTISTGPFSMAMLVHQRVEPDDLAHDDLAHDDLDDLA